MTLVTSHEACPGCGSVEYYQTNPEWCDNCHYFDLKTGRVHYCGKETCHCRALRGEMPRRILEQFTPAAGRKR